MDVFGRRFTHFQIDGGTLEARHFDCPPETGGHIVFHPHKQPMFYLVAVDVEGYETFLDQKPTKAEVMATAQVLWHVYDVPQVLDFTSHSVPAVAHLRPSEGGWSHICVSGGTTKPKTFNLAPCLRVDPNGHCTTYPEAPCFYACVIDERGYEWPVYTGYSLDDARLKAAEAMGAYEVQAVVDLTVMGSA